MKKPSWKDWGEAIVLFMVSVVSLIVAIVRFSDTSVMVTAFIGAFCFAVLSFVQIYLILTKPHFDKDKAMAKQVVREFFENCFSYCTLEDVVKMTRDKFNISNYTCRSNVVHLAIRELEEEGFLHKEKGKILKWGGPRCGILG